MKRVHEKEYMIYEEEKRVRVRVRVKRRKKREW